MCLWLLSHDLLKPMKWYLYVGHSCPGPSGGSFPGGVCHTTVPYCQARGGGLDDQPTTTPCSLKHTLFITNSFQILFTYTFTYSHN